MRRKVYLLVVLCILAIGSTVACNKKDLEQSSGATPTVVTPGIEKEVSVTQTPEATPSSTPTPTPDPQGSTSYERAAWAESPVWSQEIFEYYLVKRDMTTNYKEAYVFEDDIPGYMTVLCKYGLNGLTVTFSYSAPAGDLEIKIDPNDSDTVLVTACIFRDRNNVFQFTDVAVPQESLSEFLASAAGRSKSDESAAGFNEKERQSIIDIYYARFYQLFAKVCKANALDVSDILNLKESTAVSATTEALNEKKKYAVHQFDGEGKALDNGMSWVEYMRAAIKAEYNQQGSTLTGIGARNQYMLYQTDTIHYSVSGDSFIFEYIAGRSVDGYRMLQLIMPSQLPAEKITVEYTVGGKMVQKHDNGIPYWDVNEKYELSFSCQPSELYQMLAMGESIDSILSYSVFVTGSDGIRQNGTYTKEEIEKIRGEKGEYYSREQIVARFLEDVPRFIKCLDQGLSQYKTSFEDCGIRY